MNQELQTTPPRIDLKEGHAYPIAASMAFQPIVDIYTGELFAFEALVRGPHGEPSASVLEQVTPENRSAFDQGCRIQALTLASELNLGRSDARLAINLMPQAVSSPAACVRQTLKIAQQFDFPADRIIIEVTEPQDARGRAHLRTIVEEFRSNRIAVALDDFGAAFSGLNLLADFPADFIKLDMALTRNVAIRPAAVAIISSMVELAATLGSDIIAEGVETVDEYVALRRCGVRLMQGYLFARPAFQTLPNFMLPNIIEPPPPFPLPRPPRYLPIIFT